MIIEYSDYDKSVFGVEEPFQYAWLDKVVFLHSKTSITRFGIIVQKQINERIEISNFIT